MSHSHGHSHGGMSQEHDHKHHNNTLTIENLDNGNKVKEMFANQVLIKTNHGIK